LEIVAGANALARELVRPVLTIGNFDGVHLGHRAIMDTVIERARLLEGEAVVLTFDPHPRKVLQPDRAPSLLATREQKLEVLEAVGIDVAIVQPFDLSFARTTPEAFVREIIWDCIRPREVFVGYDFHFGRDREGSMAALCEIGAGLGFSVTIIPEIRVNDRDVNSTRIRELLAEGDVEEAAVLLGRPFAVRSRVLEGDRRGRTLGFPTANLVPENELLPSPGVYAGEVRVLAGPGSNGGGDDGVERKEERYGAVVNVGRRPTFYADGRLLAEAHLLDFEGDIYGASVELAFRERLRPEQKFPGPEALKVQIAADVELAREKLAAR
jgi:riboflavin kinase/FMN adenylyltransferase